MNTGSGLEMPFPVAWVPRSQDWILNEFYEQSPLELKHSLTPFLKRPPSTTLLALKFFHSSPDLNHWPFFTRFKV